MAMHETRVESIDDLRSHMPAILKAVNAQRDLALRAAVNPLFAIAELGYIVPDHLLRAVEHRIRFSPEQGSRLEQLAEKIHKHAGHSFDIESPDELGNVLFSELKLRPGSGAVAASLPRMRWAQADPETLDALRGTHPIIEPLLEYRKIEASEPRLGTRDLYDKVANGSVRLPITEISFKLHRGAQPS